MRSTPNSTPCCPLAPLDLALRLASMKGSPPFHCASTRGPPSSTKTNTFCPWNARHSAKGAGASGQQRAVAGQEQQQRGADERGKQGGQLGGQRTTSQRATGREGNGWRMAGGRRWRAGRERERADTTWWVVIADARRGRDRWTGRDGSVERGGQRDAGAVRRSVYGSTEG